MFFHKLLDLLSDKRFPWLFWHQTDRLFSKRETRDTKSILMALTFDVEQDGGSGGKKSYEKAKTFLGTIKKVLNKKPATFFVQGDLVEELSQKLVSLKDRHELGLHGFTHNQLWGKDTWFLKDKSMGRKEKRESLKQALLNFSKAGLSRPCSFRAPNMIIDKESMGILNKYGFKIDSSFSSFRSFSSPFIEEEILEIPVSSLPKPKIRFLNLVPTLDFQVLNMGTLRRLPNNIWQKNIRQMLSFSKNGHLVFLGHSWDFDKQGFQNLIDFLEKNWQIRYLTMQKLAQELSKESL